LNPLKKTFGNDLFNKLKLIEVDLLNEHSIDLAIKDCDYVVHTASPFPLKAPEDEFDLIKPAVLGT
jgi:nucleoside-diphosphate-sugar epimerase